MSYYFNFKAASKEEAKQKAAAEMDRVVEQQPIHRNDQKQALAAAGAFIDLCPEPKDGEVVHVTVSGSVTWRGDMDNQDIIGAGVNVTAGVGPAPKQ